MNETCPDSALAQELWFSYSKQDESWLGEEVHGGQEGILQPPLNLYLIFFQKILQYIFYQIS